MLEDKNVELSDDRPCNAAIYVRVACKNDVAVKKQETMLLRYAEEHGYRNALVYVDNGASGRTFDRPAMGRLCADIITGKVRSVIVKDLTRISRDIYEVFDWLRGLSSCGVALLSVDDEIGNESFIRNNPLFRVYCSFAEREVFEKYLSERLERQRSQ